MHNIITAIVGNIETNCYIVFSEKKNALIIDPGDEAQKIMKLLKDNELTPVKIALTHGHHDHIGAIKELKEVYPDLCVMIGEYDAPMLADVSLNLARLRYPTTERFDGLKEDLQLKDKDTFTLDELEFAVMHTPGHTKGGIVMVCKDTLFTGDTIFEGTVGRTDLPGGNYEQILASVAYVAKLEGDYTILSGHGIPTTLDHERKYNQFF